MSNAEELPIRLAHRVRDLDELPNKLNEMPSIIKVKNWYAQSFEVSSESSALYDGDLPLTLVRISLGTDKLSEAKSTARHSKGAGWRTARELTGNEAKSEFTSAYGRERAR